MNPKEQIEYINSLIQIGKISKIREIKNLHQESQKYVIELGAYLYPYINNPTQKTKLAAIAQNPFVIKNIKKPSEKMCLVAVERNPRSIQLIHHPSEKVQLLAARKSNYNPIIDLFCSSDVLERIKTERIIREIIK